jgi:hypothetical protein
MIDPMTSTDAISRKRQRNEICVTLKRSSIIHDVYIGKNCVEVIMVFIYLSIDISFFVTDQVLTVFFEFNYQIEFNLLF